MTDISSKEHIMHLVQSFYDKVLKNEHLSPFFERFNFEEHLPKMVKFWAFILLDEAGYTTDVTRIHAKMPLEKIHFEEWLGLFYATVDELFQGPKADLAKQRAFLVGWTMQSKR